MHRPNTATPPTSIDTGTVDRDRDRGAILPLVLVLTVIGALVVLPLLSYSTTVFRANRVVSTRTAQVEAARAGLRVALADPVDTFERCGAAGLNTAVALPGPGLQIATTTTCNLLDVAAARDNSSVPYSVAHTWFGEPSVTGTGTVGFIWDGTTVADETGWIPLSTDDGQPVPNEGDPANPTRTIWSPDLPVHSLTTRSPLGFEMPTGYPFGSYETCTVYFPGSYPQPLEITGPTYFTSGVYYFEDEVRIKGTSFVGDEPTDVLAGQGTLEGCIDDQYAVFYATDAPAGHNVTALGATFVFGDDGRLVIDDAAGPVRFRMNQRYVKDDDDANLPSEQVSIMTVNGVYDEATSTFTDLEIPGSLVVPKSYVGGTEADRPAIDDRYRPSKLTPAPRPPDTPQSVNVSDRDEGVVVEWVAPVRDGGSPITSYRARIVDSNGTPMGKFCEATETTSCAITGLSNDYQHRVDVIAKNAIGTSVPTEAQTFRPDSGDTSISTPARPDGVSIDESDTIPLIALSLLSRYSDAFVVEIDPASNTGNAPIDAYEVEVTTTDLVGDTDTYTCTTAGATSCAVTGLSYSDLDLRTFSIAVRARNAVGWSSWRTSAGLFALDPLGEPYEEPAAPTSPRYEPDPIVDIASTSGHKLEVYVPGYIAAPQGVISVSVANGADKDVSLSGGTIAAWSTITEPRPATFTYGLLNPATQRIVRIRTTVAGSHVSAEAVVQINETGAWAVNSWMVQ